MLCISHYHKKYLKNCVRTWEPDHWGRDNVDPAAWKASFYGHGNTLGRLFEFDHLTAYLAFKLAWQ